jgi:hypothetical protein
MKGKKKEQLKRNKFIKSNLETSALARSKVKSVHVGKVARSEVTKVELDLRNIQLGILRLKCQRSDLWLDIGVEYAIPET